MFKGAAGNRLVADVYGDTGQPVLLLHGGGQTRHAWRRTAEHPGRSGAIAYALDQRGHGDPAVLKGNRSFAIDHRILEQAVIEAAKAITIPALLVRGGSSELVHEAHVREFLELVPHADYIDVAEARHMVAADANDSFSDAVLDFVGKLDDS